MLPMGTNFLPEDVVLASSRDERAIVMESLFEERTRSARGAFDEVRLKAVFSAMEILRPDYTWEEFSTLARGKIVWMNSRVFIGLGIDGECFRNLGYEPVLCIRLVLTLGGDEEVLRVWSFSRREALWAPALVVCEALLELLTRSHSYTVRIAFEAFRPTDPWVSSLALSELLTNIRGLIELHFSQHMILTDEYLHVLEAAVSSNLRITLYESSLSDIEPVVLKGFFLRFRGTIAFYHCKLTIPLLSDVLRGNSSIEELHLGADPPNPGMYQNDSPDINDSDMPELLQTLATNQNLKAMRIYLTHVSDENWILLTQIVGRHPTLKTLTLTSKQSVTDPYELHGVASKTRRAKAVIEMLVANTTLEELFVSDSECDERILRDVIRPYTQDLANIRALSEYQSLGRPQVLGRALYKVHHSPALVWILFSNNVAELTSELPSV
jgi:hypothetical protein